MSFGISKGVFKFVGTGGVNDQTVTVDMESSVNQTKFSTTGSTFNFQGTTIISGRLRAGLGMDFGAATTKITGVGGVSDGDLLITDSTELDFGLLKFGGQTTSYPAIKRSATNLQVRLADDSAFTDLRAATIFADAGTAGDWVSISHDQTDGIIDLGSGGLNTISAGSPLIEADFSRINIYNSLGLFAKFIDDGTVRVLSVGGRDPSGDPGGGGGFAPLGGVDTVLFIGHSDTNNVNVTYEARSNRSLAHTLQHIGTGPARIQFARGAGAVFGTTTKWIIQMATDGAGNHLSITNHFAATNHDVLKFDATDASDITARADNTLLKNAADTHPSALRAGLLVEANTAVAASPNIITFDESRTFFTNEGVTALNHHDLPTAAAGIEFTFYIQDANGMQINAATGDTIRIGSSVSASAGNISSTTVGECITLVAINATEWVAKSVINASNWTVT